jgi:hypothetical protein
LFQPAVLGTGKPARSLAVRIQFRRPKRSLFHPVHELHRVVSAEIVQYRAATALVGCTIVEEERWTVYQSLRLNDPPNLTQHVPFSLERLLSHIHPGPPEESEAFVREIHEQRRIDGWFRRRPPDWSLTPTSRYLFAPQHLQLIRGYELVVSSCQSREMRQGVLHAAWAFATAHSGLRFVTRVYYQGRRMSSADAWIAVSAFAAGGLAGDEQYGSLSSPAQFADCVRTLAACLSDPPHLRLSVFVSSTRPPSRPG